MDFFYVVIIVFYQLTQPTGIPFEISNTTLHAIRIGQDIENVNCGPNQDR
jgi:hypothetical protein